ncbi:MAG: DUF4349 domain-containing protein [Longimicrobiaceae bacterium]
MPRLRQLPVFILFPLFAAGCAKERSSGEMYDIERPEAPAKVAEPTVGSAARDRAAASDGDAAAPSFAAADTTAPAPPGDTSSAAPGANARPVIPQMIIRTGTATVRVDSLEKAMAQVEQLARRLGGYVANTAVQSGSENVRQASMELKIPAERWGQALGGLKPIGKMESQQTTTEDVGEEYVDVTARMANARRLESRLLDLLGTRTGKLEDVLAVESELARVREEIERYEGRLRFLRTRAAVSTLTVQLHEPSPVLAPGRSPILDAFRQAWRNFVGFTAGLIESLGWLIPLVLVLAAFVWLLRRLLGRRGPGAGPRFRWWRRGGPPTSPPPGSSPPAGPPSQGNA